MDQQELRELQAPIKQRYSEDPDAARITLHASGSLGDGVTCSVQVGRALGQAGLHPASGGDGSLLCSGDMLLEALVACAGVTLRAVATSLGIAVAAGEVLAEGDLDFRGTLGVERDAPVGFSAIRLSFALDSDADDGAARHADEADRALLRGAPDARSKPAPVDVAVALARRRLARRAARLWLVAATGRV